MTDRDEIVETITRLFWHTDHHEWSDVEVVFDEVVRLDYTSLQGGEPAQLSPAEIVAGWSSHFATIGAHQHLVTNHLVTITDGTATVTAQFLASHQTGEEVWSLGGDYHFDLARRDAGWKIGAMTMTAVWQSPGPPPTPPA